MTSKQKLATIIEKAEQILALDTRNNEEGSSRSYSKEFGYTLFLVSKKLKNSINDIVVQCSVEIMIKDGNVRTQVVEMYDDGCGRIVSANDDGLIKYIDAILDSLQ